MRKFFFGIFYGPGRFLEAFMEMPLWGSVSRNPAQNPIRYAEENVQQRLQRFAQDSNPTFIRDDSEAMAEDWQKVGLDMRNAINEYAAQTR